MNTIHKKNMLESFYTSCEKYIKKIIEYFINILFPIECLQCQKPNTLLCQNCLSSLHTRLNYSNLSSGIPVYSAYGFPIPIIKKIITRAKYYHSSLLFEDLTLHAIPTLAPVFSLHKNSKIFLVPIPLHYIRKQKRGFNQSEIIAHTFANTFEHCEVLDIITRKKHTPQQAKLNKKERQKNIKNCFSIDKNISGSLSEKNIHNAQFFIIDDVISTGSTIIEAEHILEKYGKIPKKHITAVSLCRGG